MELWLTSLISAFLAGCVACLSTLAIESLGGALGGILSTAPSLIAVNSVAFASRMAGLPLKATLFTVPVGFLMAVFFLLVWRWLPDALPKPWSDKQRMFACLLASVALWLSLAAIVVAISPGKDVSQIDTIVTAGYCAIACHIAIGLVMCLRPLPPSGPPTKTPLRIHLVRGSGAALATGVAILMSKLGDVIAGFASSFPILFLITMISLWAAGKGGLAKSATGPMILGSSSISFFAIVFALMVTKGSKELEPGQDGSDGNGDVVGADSELHAMPPLVAAAITWCLALVCVSLPSYFFLRWRRSLSAPPGPVAVKEEPAAIAGAAVDVAAMKTDSAVNAASSAGLAFEMAGKQVALETLVPVSAATVTTSDAIYSSTLQERLKAKIAERTAGERLEWQEHESNKNEGTIHDDGASRSENPTRLTTWTATRADEDDDKAVPEWT